MKLILIYECVFGEKGLQITVWGFAFGRAIEAQKLNLLLMFN